MLNDQHSRINRRWDSDRSELHQKWYFIWRYGYHPYVLTPLRIQVASVHSAFPQEPLCVYYCPAFALTYFS
jgi:hypothetical protein